MITRTSDKSASLRIGLLVMCDAWGGSELFSVRFARSLEQRGHTVDIVCLSDKTFQLYRERSPFQVRLVCLPAPKPVRAMGCLDWRRLFASQSFSVCVFVKCEFEHCTWTFDLASRFRFGAFITIEQLDAHPLPTRVSKRHFGILPGFGLWWYQELFRRYFRSVGPRKVICVSDTCRKRLIEDYRFPARKVLTVHNGIDPRQFRPDVCHRDNWRQRLGIPASALVFGAIGRLDPVKNFQTAVTSFATLLSRNVDGDFWLLLAGEGPSERELREKAEQLAPGRVVFAPFCRQPWEILNAIDVFLMPSRNEGLPMTLLEAMACGCCPVAAAAGGIPDVIENSELGWLVPAGNPTAFANAMIEAAEQTPEARRAMGVRCRARVSKHFDAAVQFDEFAKIVESIAEPTQPSRRGRSASADVRVEVSTKMAKQNRQYERRND